MNQAGQNLLDGKLLKVCARLAQHDAARLYLADPELFPDQMIKRHAARDNVAAAIA